MISVCMLAKDAEKTIGSAINVALELGDEVVIRVDQSSKDGTHEIVDKLSRDINKVVMEEYEFTGFGSARNGLVHRATKPWVFMLDTDEVLDASAIAAIKMVICNVPLSEAIYTFPRHNWVDFGRSDFRHDHYPDRQARLFPGGGKINYGEQLVHEMPRGLPYTKFPVLDVHIEHFCFAIRGSEEWHRANQFYARLREEERRGKTKG